MSAIRFLSRTGKNALRQQQQQSQQFLCTYSRALLFNRQPATVAATQFAIKYAPAVSNGNSRLFRDFSTKTSPDHAGKSDTKSSPALSDEIDLFGTSSKLGLFAKFKLMYKKYWYVLIPVHAVTSVGWFGGFYYLSKSGVDIPSLLQYIHFSETIIEKLHTSNMGHYAIAYLLYKIATPLRYAVTLGGTTVSIKYLVQSGHIKPMPSKRELMQMYEQKKADRAAAKDAEDIATKARHEHTSKNK